MATATERYRYARLRLPTFGIDVPTVNAGRAIYFPLKAFCDALGLAGASMQIKRLKEDTRFGDGALRELPIPTIKGERTAICLRKQQVGMWLSQLDTGRAQLKDNVRGRLEEFQRDLFAAAERFLFGDMSDVVQSEERGAKPIYGLIHLGDCPRCGLALCLTIDETGQHLAPDVSADDE